MPEDVVGRGQGTGGGQRGMESMLCPMCGCARNELSTKMTEHDRKLNEELASTFIVSTCQLVSKSSCDIYDQMHNLTGSTDLVPKQYSILCGSFAEFYIRPLHPCICDIDFLISYSQFLAFSGDYPVLPTDMSGLAETITCSNIEPDPNYPGFVRLRFFREINYNWRYKKYELKTVGRLGGIRTYLKYTKVQKSVTWYSSSTRIDHPRKSFASGPAVSHKPDNEDTHIGIDSVRSVWCPQWPREAQNWPFRPRNHEWPPIDKISEVVQQGCHVVYVQHRSCRDDELQWRLSFSVAELILLQSWTQIQQIVYHMLRFFAKRELMQKSCPKGDEILCTYHLKTLMLWTCEDMSPEWWNSSSIFAICSYLLQKLAGWLKRKHCPNYFIPEANLFHEQLNLKMYEKTEGLLNKFCIPGILCDWFVENYIELFTRKFRPTEEDTNGRKIPLPFMDYAMCLFEGRKVSESTSLNRMLYFRLAASYHNCRPVFKQGLSSGLRQKYNIGCYLKTLDAKIDRLMTFLPTVDNDLCFVHFDNVLHILHAAYGLSVGEISWESSTFVELMRAISMQPTPVRSGYHNFPKMDTERSGRFQFLRAQNLMHNLTGSNSHSEFQLISIMSKELLRKALEYDVSKLDGIAPAALAYLAALHFLASEYQQAIRYCSAVLADQTPQEEMETLNAGCLLFIDDVTRIVGLGVFQKKVTDNNLQYIGRRIYLDLRLSPQVFARYLAVSSSARISIDFDVEHDLPVSAYPLDENLKVLLKSKCDISLKSCTHISSARRMVYCRTDSFRDAKITVASPFIVKETVIYALMGCALEHMALFQSEFRKEFRFQCNAVDCYRALHLYKCRQYDETLHICERILLEHDLRNGLRDFAFANVLLFPPFDSFFDGDVQCLLAFHTLFYYLSPLNEEAPDHKSTLESTFALWFAVRVYLCGQPLSTSIERPDFIKCCYALRRHFLARYLKVRCCIDCNLPYAEALGEFAAEKVYLPFEYIIRRYLLQKLLVIKK